MDFDTYAQRAQSLHRTWLESGGQDEAALTQGITAAYRALESLPPGRLTERQQDYWENLAEIYRDRSPEGKTWHPEFQQGWFEDALAMLQEVQP